MKRASESSWQEVPSTVEVDLSGDGEILVFRAVNLAGVSGPEHKVVVALEGSR
jgi:hypothetical protein